MGNGGSAHLVHDIFEGVGAVNCEADEEKIGLGIGERTETVVFFLTGGVPECELDCLARRLVVGGGDVIFEDCGDVFLVWMSALSFPHVLTRRVLLTSGKMP